jgi:hypothetical protein
MLLVVIAALCAALVVQQRRAAVREVELQARLVMSELGLAKMAINRELEKLASEFKDNADRK